jgi:hypothetical protein
MANGVAIVTRAAATVPPLRRASAPGFAQRGARFPSDRGLLGHDGVV